MAEHRSILESLELQRQILEAEADAIFSELTAPGSNGEPPAGVKEPLVDHEGFPRSDIDIYNVRAKRQRLAILNTDHKAIMFQLQSLLVTYHSAVASEELSVITPSPKAASQSDTAVKRGFAIIDEISPQSPAMASGLKVEDVLVCFGTASLLTVENPLSMIPNIVSEHINKVIGITVLRGGDIINLDVIPSVWGGRGLLGCHLKPL